MLKRSYRYIRCSWEVDEEKKFSLSCSSTINPTQWKVQFGSLTPAALLLLLLSVVGFALVCDCECSPRNQEPPSCSLGGGTVLIMIFLFMFFLSRSGWPLCEPLPLPRGLQFRYLAPHPRILSVLRINVQQNMESPPNSKDDQRGRENGEKNVLSQRLQHGFRRLEKLGLR